MAHFMIRALDKPDSTSLRAATRPDHLAYLTAFEAQIVAAGAMLDPVAHTPLGSLLVVDMADAEAVRAFMAGDPYAKAGLFQSVEVLPWRKVYPKEA